MVVASGECRGEAMCIAAGRLNSMNGQPSTPQWAPMNLEALGCIKLYLLYLHSVFLLPQSHTEHADLPRSVEKATSDGMFMRFMCSVHFCALCCVVGSSFAHFVISKLEAPAKPTTPSGVGGSAFQTVNPGDSLFLPRFRKLAIWRETHRIVTNSVYFMIVSHHASATPKTRSSTAWSLPELIPA